MKILNLILYNNADDYRDMRDILRVYLKAKNIKYYFYCFKQDIDDDYAIEGDMLYIKGTESFNPGITEKTIKSIILANELFTFDYIVRSNISTIVDMDKIQKYLEDNPIEYGGGYKHVLEWIDNPAGIYDKKYWGTEFISGTCFILSKKTVDKICENKGDIIWEIMDDVCIGAFCKKHNIPATNIGCFATNVNFYLPDKIFYRNRRPSRKDDVAAFRKIIPRILDPIKIEVEAKKKIHLVKKALYGKDMIDKKIYRDVLDKMYLFIDGNKIVINKTQKFNDYFGDPLVGIVKELILEVNDKEYVLPENRDTDIEIDLILP